MRKVICKFLFFAPAVIAGMIMQSCAPVLSLNYTQSGLAKEMSYSAVELSMSNFTTSQFSCPVSLGLGTVNQSEDYWLLAWNESGDEFDENSIYGKTFFEEEMAYLLGAKPTFFFTHGGRFQPFIAGDLTYCYLNDDHGYFANFRPNLGARFFLANRFAINGNIGYQLGYMNIKDTYYDDNQTYAVPTNFARGFSFSLGITFSFGQ